MEGKAATASGERAGKRASFKFVVLKIVNQKGLDTLAVSPLKTPAPVSRSARALFYEKTN
jgi:hypothetical protein